MLSWMRDFPISRLVMCLKVLDSSEAIGSGTLSMDGFICAVAKGSPYDVLRAEADASS